MTPFGLLQKPTLRLERGFFYTTILLPEAPRKIRKIPEHPAEPLQSKIPDFAGIFAKRLHEAVRPRRLPPLS